MSAFPAGVAIVTAVEPGDQPRGMTCTSLCSVTLSPPTILVCLRAGSPTLAAILVKATFAVNLLHQAAQPTAELFASGAPDRFDRVRWYCGPDLGGPQLLDDAHAAAHCIVCRAEHVGDHVIVVGEVFKTWTRPERSQPLLYGQRRYAAWPKRLRYSGYEASARGKRAAHDRSAVP
jgi:flavin reductase (DIM6/NTAB) family NADH-FMN oxidoreductase RutF